MISHEHTKHIEVDSHYIRDLLMQKYIVTPRILGELIEDMVTKPLPCFTFQQLTIKLACLIFMLVLLVY